MKLFSGLLQDPWRCALGSLTPTQSGGELSATRKQGDKHKTSPEPPKRDSQCMQATAAVRCYSPSLQAWFPRLTSLVLGRTCKGEYRALKDWHLLIMWSKSGQTAVKVQTSKLKSFSELRGIISLPAPAHSGGPQGLSSKYLRFQ